MPEVQSLILKIVADAKGYKTTINEAVASTGKLSKSSNKLIGSLKELNRISAMAFGAMAGALAAVSVQYAKFERRMVNVGSVLGQHYSQMDELVMKARELGKTTEFTASQAGDAMYYLASAGYETVQIMGAVDSVLQLASATQHDLSETSRIVVGNLNAFNLAAEDADRVVDVFAAAISASQATMDKLGVSMAYVAPVASQLGVSIEETSAMLSKLFDAGIESSRAGTMLRMALLKLINPTRGAKIALKEMGLAAEDVNPEFIEMFDIIDTLAKKQMSAGQAARIFGARAQGAMSILARVGREELQEFTDRISGTNKAQEMMAIQLNSLVGKYNIMKSALTELAITLGTHLAPMLAKVTGLLTGMFKWFSDLPSVLTGTIMTFAAVTTVVMGGVAAFGALAAMLPVVIAKLGIANAMLFGMPLVVGAIVTAIIGMTGAFGDANDEIGNTTNAIGEFLDKNREVMNELEELKGIYDELNEKEEKSAREKKKLAEATKKLGDLLPTTVDLITDEGDALSLNNIELERAIEAKKELYDLEKEQAMNKARTRFDEVAEELKLAETEKESTKKRHKGLQKTKIFYEDMLKRWKEQGLEIQQVERTLADYTDREQTALDVRTAAQKAFNEKLAEEAKLKKILGLIEQPWGMEITGDPKRKPVGDPAAAAAKKEAIALKERIKRRQEFFKTLNQMQTERTENEKGKFEADRKTFAEHHNELFRIAETALQELNKKGSISNEEYQMFLIELERWSAAEKKKIADEEAEHKRRIRIKALKAQLKGEIENLKEIDKRYKEVYRNLEQVIGGPINDAFDKVIKGTLSVEEAFKVMLDDIKAQIVKFLVSKAVSTALMFIADFITAGGGSAAGKAKGIGKVIANLGKPAVGAAGLVTKNVQGPISAVLHGNEAVVPLKKLAPMMKQAMIEASAGGRGTVHNHFPVTPVSYDEERFYENMWRNKMVPQETKFNKLKGEENG